MNNELIPAQKVYITTPNGEIYLDEIEDMSSTSLHKFFNWLVLQKAELQAVKEAWTPEDEGFCKDKSIRAKVKLRIIFEFLAAVKEELQWRKDSEAKLALNKERQHAMRFMKRIKKIMPSSADFIEKTWNECSQLEENLSSAA